MAMAIAFVAFFHRLPFLITQLITSILITLPRDAIIECGKVRDLKGSTQGGNFQTLNNTGGGALDGLSDKLKDVSSLLSKRLAYGKNRSNKSHAHLTLCAKAFFTIKDNLT